MKNIALLLLMAVAVMVGCKNDNKAKETVSSVVKSTGLEHGYKYDNLNTKVEWTAFKFTSKAPVGGVINSFKVTSTKEAATIEGLLNGLTFEVDAAAIDSKNEVRNGRIIQHFFGALSTGTKITGSINKIEGNKALTTITFNGKSNEVALNYIMEAGKVTLDGTIDVAKWNGMNGINALNLACKDLHTGPDGKTKLWSEVDIKITSKIDKF